MWIRMWFFYVTRNVVVEAWVETFVKLQQIFKWLLNIKMNDFWMLRNIYDQYYNNK